VNAAVLFSSASAAAQIPEGEAGIGVSSPPKYFSVLRFPSVSAVKIDSRSLAPGVVVFRRRCARRKPVCRLKQACSTAVVTPSVVTTSS
jgi:hypothetical protein